MSFRKYDQSNTYKTKTRKEVLKNAEDLFKVRNKIIKVFEDGTFQLAEDVQEKQTKEVNFEWLHRPKDELESVIEEIKLNSGLESSICGKKVTLSVLEDFLNDIVTGKIDNKYDAEKENREKTLDDEKLLEKTKFARSSRKWTLKDIIDKAKYAVFRVLFPSEDDEKPKNTGEQPDIIDMPPLEIQESAAQRREHEGKGLKILTPQQMLSRLPISLAQLKAGNNSQKLKNEARQLVYSLYRSKKLSKTVYKHLMNAI